MELPPRGGGFRQSRRSRSQRDRDRRRRSGEARLFSPSSGSEREGPGTAPSSSRPRPPRRRKRESSSCEEDLIDGFAIASFISLEALEKDVALKPPERLEHRLKRSGKRKRNEENGSEQEDQQDESSERDLNQPNGERETRKLCKKRKREGKSVRMSESESLRGENVGPRDGNSRRAGSEGSLQSCLETGYICDTESDSDDKASDDEHEKYFTVSMSNASESNGALNGTCESKLSVIPKVSGLERSQERNQEPEKDPLLVPFLPKESPSQATLSGQPQAAAHTQAEVCSLASGQARPPTPLQALSQPLNQNSLRATPQPKPQTPQNPPQSQQQPKVYPFSCSQSHSAYSGGLGLSSSSRSSTPAKLTAPASQLPHRPSTPSLALSNHSASHGFSSTLRPPSHPHHHHPQAGMFTPSPGLPPPPPLQQVAGHPAAATAAAFSEQDLIRHELNSRFLTTQGATTERGSTIGPPLAFQFHQHNHQHQHTHQHTHQHFTPYPPTIVPAPPMFEKYPGKIDGLYRHNFYSSFPHSVSGIQPVLPPAGPFSSLQGAFQPKTTNPELAARLGAVPPGVPQKDPRVRETGTPPLWKTGKWCAMHVRVAYMILRHQDKVKKETVLQVHSDSVQLQTESVAHSASVLSRKAVTPPHKMVVKAAAVSVLGAAPPSAPHNAFINASAHIDPFGHPAGFAPLGALSNGAFGGLGNLSSCCSSLYGQKESPSAQGFSSPHDPWNRLHRTPSSFPMAPAPAPSQPWPKPGELERHPHDRDREPDKRDTPVIKDERDRDALYNRHSIRVSPIAPNHKSTVASMAAAAAHSNGRASVESERGHGSNEVRDRAPSREREREHSHTPKDPHPSLQQEHKPREGLPTPEESLALVKRLSEDSSKSVGRETSPYIRTPYGESARPGSSGAERKPVLTPPDPRKHEVKVKEERKEEPEVTISNFELGQPQQAANVLQQHHHASLHAIPTVHSGVSVPMHVGPGGLHPLSVFDRPRVMSPYLGVGPAMPAGERFPHPVYGYEAWREAYRNAELHRRDLLGRDLALRTDAIQRFTPRFFDHERALRERELQELDARRESERNALLEEQERAHILREDYERARLYGMQASPLDTPHITHHGLLPPGLGGLAYSRLNPAIAHQNGILSKTPPISVPPPLIPSTVTRSGSPRRSTPLSGADIRELAAMYKDRDSR
uniref:Fibrosin like 1 n=1 Tax=Latimeria chalumnae TaxID=7897 RepID=H3AL50_LATCH